MKLDRKAEARRAVDACPGLNGALREGLTALSGKHREQVRADMPRMLLGSVNIDEALSKSHSRESRWDYFVAESRLHRGSAAHWIEVHPATDGEVKTVIAKLDWLRDWWQGDGRAIGSFGGDRTIVWIASGRVGISGPSPARKKLAMHGIRFVGRHYRIN